MATASCRLLPEVKIRKEHPPPKWSPMATASYRLLPEVTIMKALTTPPPPPKWSPVATASYRLLPEVTIRKELRGDEARELVQKCPMKVLEIFFEIYLRFA